jgi:hypothetical protein
MDRSPCSWRLDPRTLFLDGHHHDGTLVLAHRMWPRRLSDKHSTMSLVFIVPSTAGALRLAVLARQSAIAAPTIYPMESHVPSTGRKRPRRGYVTARRVATMGDGAFASSDLVAPRRRMAFVPRGFGLDRTFGARWFPSLETGGVADHFRPWSPHVVRGAIQDYLDATIFALSPLSVRRVRIRHFCPSFWPRYWRLHVRQRLVGLYTWLQRIRPVPHCE